jgi:hypothetical protein
MQLFSGYLFAKLATIGTRSEGPSYWLQTLTETESHQIDEAIAIRKNASAWEVDPVLHPFLNRKVAIIGQLTQDNIIYYKGIRAQTLAMGAQEATLLELSLEVKSAISENLLEVRLAVGWPCRSVWHSVAPTSQLYDFVLSREGETVCKWSTDQLFVARERPVQLIGGREYIFTELWFIDPRAIAGDGPYTITASFIPAGQTYQQTV